MAAQPQPFTLNVSDQKIADLRERLGRTRFPDQVRGEPIPDGAAIDLPMGHAQFPAEILRPPRSLAERTYTNIRRWSVMPRGGHFAALEQPEALAAEVREFFRPLRPS